MTAVLNSFAGAPGPDESGDVALERHRATVTGCDGCRAGWGNAPPNRPTFTSKPRQKEKTE